VVELIIAIGMAAIMIVSIGGALNSVYKLNMRSEMREKALAYAKEYLEIINEKQNDEFACICNPAPCSPCIKGSQSCNPSTGYSSCWMKFPDGLGTNNPLYLNKITNSLQTTPDPLDNISPFNREIAIENLGDFNRKKITVTVTWPEQGSTKTVILSTILTGWKNL